MDRQISKGRYSLRYAAGQYWLLDLEQKGIPYKPPVSLNDVGAQMWSMLQEGISTEQMAEVLCKEYDIDKKEIHEDILLFQEQLKKQGIITGE